MGYVHTAQLCVQKNVNELWFLLQIPIHKVKAMGILKYIWSGISLNFRFHVPCTIWFPSALIPWKLHITIRAHIVSNWYSRCRSAILRYYKWRISQNARLRPVISCKYEHLLHVSTWSIICESLTLQCLMSYSIHYNQTRQH